MVVRKLRLQKAWSQEHLAELTGLSTRTIKRIEKGEKPGLESIRLLAEAFDIDAQILQEEILHERSGANSKEKTETTHIHIADDEREAMEYVKRLKEFYIHLTIFITVVIVLLTIKLIVPPHDLVVPPHLHWIIWLMFGWTIGIVIHAVKIFKPFDYMTPEWEKKQIEKRLGRDF